MTGVQTCALPISSTGINFKVEDLPVDSQRLNELKEDANPNHSLEIDNKGSIGDSVSSQGSVISDNNAVKELKMSLFERTYPKTVTLLKYTIWLLILVLFTICTIDWVISISKINKNSDGFNLINRTTMRVALLGLLSIHTHNKQLLAW